jgi:hypothetical protein
MAVFEINTTDLVARSKTAIVARSSRAQLCGGRGHRPWPYLDTIIKRSERFSPIGSRNITQTPFDSQLEHHGQQSRHDRNHQGYSPRI